MIKKLKRKFILLATISIFLLMTVLVFTMNIINYTSVIADTNRILDVLSHTNAPFFEEQHPEEPRPEEPRPMEEPHRKAEDILPPGMSPEVPYESRYFSVLLSESGAVLDTDISKIISVDQSSVAEYVRQATQSQAERGFVDQFRFAKSTDHRGTKIIFLDCGRKLDAFYHFMWISAAIGFLGCVLVFFVFLLAANRIVRPIAESYEKQKRFITDAGHEIKTPLTIIGANVDLLEADIGSNESLDDIRQQTRRLTALTGDLVYLSKMEESENNLPKIEFPVSDLITETAASFHTLALSQNKTYTMRVQPALSMNGAPEAIRQLVSILLENAFKYSPEDGIVTLDFYLQKKTLILSVGNTTMELLSQDNLSHLFERFYRTDTSHNSETGGHGIGLSIAQAITLSHNGKIIAATENDDHFKITVTLPIS